MSEISTKCLDLFPKWLQSLGDDIGVIVTALKSDAMTDEARHHLLGGVNYLFKSLDLIPDGIDDIGYLDDAFMLRLTVKAAFEGDMGAIEGVTREKLDKLAADTALLREYLAPELYKRLDDYARNLKNGASRGRMVAEIINHPETFAEIVNETEAFINEFVPPAFSRDEKNLIKLTAFFEAKLPK